MRTHKANFVEKPSGTRVSAYLDDSASFALTRAVRAAGMTQAEYVKAAVMAAVTRQSLPQPFPRDDATADAVTRLVALAAVLERQIAALGEALPTAAQMDEEREEVRSSLFDLATSIGVIAGSVVPVDVEPDDGGRAQFGP